MSNKNAFLAKFQSQNHQSSQDEYNQNINKIFSLNKEIIMEHVFSLGMSYLLENHYFMKTGYTLGDVLFAESKLELDRQIRHLFMNHNDKIEQDELFREPFVVAMNKINQINSDMLDYISELSDKFAKKLNKTIDRADFYVSTYNILEEYSSFIINDKDYTVLEENYSLLLTIGFWQLATKGIYEKNLPYMMFAVVAEAKEPLDRTTTDIIEKTFGFMLDKINNTLGMNIEVTAIEFLSSSGQEELEGFIELWQEAIKNERFAIYDTKGDLFPSLTEEDIPLNTTTYEEPQPDSKASAAILNFFDSNSNTLIAKLKDSGLQLSAAALQNDQNITRVANVVYNLLPGMVRIFVSFDTVENFLLEHRQWLINKLI